MKIENFRKLLDGGKIKAWKNLGGLKRPRKNFLGRKILDAPKNAFFVIPEGAKGEIMSCGENEIPCHKSYNETNKDSLEGTGPG